MCVCVCVCVCVGGWKHKTPMLLIKLIIPYRANILWAINFADLFKFCFKF